MRPTKPNRLPLDPRVTALLALGALFSLTAPAAAADVAEVARSTTARGSASSSAGSLGQTYPGHRYAVLGTDRDWVQVQFDERKAWLKKSDLTLRDGTVKRVTASSGLRVRAGAGANHRALGTLPNGARVVDRGGSAAWRKISFGGKDGWVSARFLARVSGASSVGIATVIDPGTSSGGASSNGGSSSSNSNSGSSSASSSSSSSSSSSRYVAWDNGRRLGPIEVVMIDGKPVAKRTAEAFLRMRDAARRDGVTLRINSGFRTYEEQERLYRLYRQGRGNLAAKPGYSNHQDGKALDLNTATPGVLSWLNRNAARFGFRRTVPSEPWHWELR